MKAVHILVATLAAATAAQGEGVSNSFVIRDVRLFDGHRVTAHRSILVRNGMIARIGGSDLATPGAEVISGEGRTLLPGIIDAHVHVAPASPEEALRQAARLGVTTVLDMFTGLDTLRHVKEIEAGDPPGMADIRSAGIGATVPHGHGTQMGGPPFPTISGPDEAQAFVDARIAEGSDYIKLFEDDGSGFGTDYRIPTLNEATLRALVEAAHRRGKLAIAHIATEAQARIAIAAGVDGLAHLFVGREVSPDFGRYARMHHVFVVPTLSVQHWWCGRSRGPAISADARLMRQTVPAFTGALGLAAGRAAPSCVATDQAVRQLRDAGVPILVGTDSPIPGTTYGASTLDEMALLVEDGLTPIEAMVAGTSAPARAFRLRDRGEIRVGARADLLLVAGDPTVNIDAVKSIVRVWKRGIPVNRVGE